MHLSKSERVYKKKLFRYIKIKKRSKQKELTATLIKSDLYKNGGFKQIYKTTKYGVKNLAKIFNCLKDVVIEVVESIKCLTEAISKKNEINKDVGK